MNLGLLRPLRLPATRSQTIKSVSGHQRAVDRLTCDSTLDRSDVCNHWKAPSSSWEHCGEVTLT